MFKKQENTKNLPSIKTFLNWDNILCSCRFYFIELQQKTFAGQIWAERCSTRLKVFSAAPGCTFGPSKALLIRRSKGQKVEAVMSRKYAAFAGARAHAQRAQWLASPDPESPAESSAATSEADLAWEAADVQLLCVGASWSWSWIWTWTWMWTWIWKLE